MSRLVQILLEREGNEDAVLTGDQYIKYSDAGNLFRLMMVTNPDQPIPQTKATGLVTKMLSGVDTSVVKKLQTSFNAINKALHAGKNPSVAIKKNYFTLLFQLLLPMTGEENMVKKTKGIASSFAGGGEKTLSAKRKVIIMIGRALLANSELQLNSVWVPVLCFSYRSASVSRSWTDDERTMDNPSFILRVSKSELVFKYYLL